MNENIDLTEILKGKDEVDKAIKLKLQRLQNRLTKDNDNAQTCC